MLKTKDNISKITIIIGTIVLIYSAYLLFRQEQPFENHDVVEGVLIDYYKLDNQNYPIVKYVVNNDTFQLRSTEVLHTFAKESRVNLKYNIDNPSEAVIYESYLFYGIPISIATIGIMIIAFGGIMLYFSSKKR